MQDNPYNDPLVPKKTSRLTRLSLITGAGLLATLIAAGLGGAASAQTVIGDEPAAVASAVRVVQERAVQVDEGFDELEWSAEDEAIWQQFEDCLTDAGLPDFEMDSTDPEPDEATVDAAFEQCDPLLESLSEEAFIGDFGDLSAEDEAVFERHDDCLVSGGIDDLFEGDGTSDDTLIDDAAIDALFDKCDPILDELSEAAQAMFDDFGDLSAEDEAVFERYDDCLVSGGIDDLFEGDGTSDDAMIDDAAIDALFDQCDPILDELSEAAQAMFDDCPEDDEHNDAVELEGAEA